MGRREGCLKRELPTWAVAAQFFIWKLFEDGFAGFFWCEGFMRRAKLGGTDVFEENIVYIYIYIYAISLPAKIKLCTS